MANLSRKEKSKLEALFRMEGGFVLTYTNRTFAEVVEESVGLDIYDDKYKRGSGSKAQRLRAFWDEEGDQTVGKLLTALLEEQRETLTHDPRYAECVQLANRMQASSEQTGSVPSSSVATSGPSHSPAPENTTATSGRAPRVFVSYSHDSPAHKAWVLSLAQEVRRSGVDVILDQWDLLPGQDVVRFMNKGVGDADKVLVICTPSYVRKANDGTGGVGYEAMIVTGELIRNLGTDKFIPVIREHGRPTVPTALSTRRHVDLSGQNTEQELESLLRTLHGTPAVNKPPLGSNPFDSRNAPRPCVNPN